MDNVPVRTNDQTTRRPVAVEPGRAPEQKRKPRTGKLKRIVISVAVVLGVAVLVLVGLFFYKSTTGATIDSSKYQAVFFTNGQVYFGKLETLNGGYMKMKDIFYLQTTTDTADSKNPQETASDANSNVQLIKLGSEVHGPEDEMIISKDQVLFFENLKKDGKVSQSIDAYQG